VAEPGDSGAPVIFVPGGFFRESVAAFLGILSGGTSVEEDVIEDVLGGDLAGAGEMVDVSYFSPIANVEAKLGPLNTCVPSLQC
jgi:hypothetical protein